MGAVGLKSLYSELQCLIDDIKSLKKGQGDRESIERRILDVIDKLSQLESDDRPDQAVSHTEKSDDVYSKLNQFKDLVTKDVRKSSTILVKSLGAELCLSCGCQPCECFSYLPAPIIKSISDDTLSISFDDSWSEMDKKAYCKALGYFVIKRNKK